MSTSLLLFKVSLTIYFIGTVIFLIDVITSNEKLGGIGRWVVRGGFAVHTLTLIMRFVETGQAPMASMHESLSFFTWLIIGVYLLVDLKYRMNILGTFVMPLATAIMIFGSTMSTDQTVAGSMLNSWWFPIHVTMAMLGYAVFALSFVAGIMYLIQERMLKSKKFTPLYQKLPSLSTLDDINYHCLCFGFLLMSMGIISGAIWANAAWGGYWRWDPKETWALITWFLYAAQLHVRLTVGWRGKRSAIFAIIGFLVVIFSYLGVNLLLHTEHSFEALSGPSF